MPRLVWSPSALHDVARLRTFLAPKSHDAAPFAVKTIRGGLKHLSKHPEIGRLVEEMLPQFREWVVEFGQSAYVWQLANIRASAHCLWRFLLTLADNKDAGPARIIGQRAHIVGQQLSDRCGSAHIAGQQRFEQTTVSLNLPPAGDRFAKRLHFSAEKWLA